MSIQPSSRIQRVKPSPTLAVTALAAQLRAEGRDVIGLAAGEPDFDTPDYIKQAAIRAIQDGHTRYTAVDGTAGLKRAIINKFERENALHYNPDQILVSVGGKQVFYNLVQALLNPGDEVIIPAPYWVSYPDMVKLADGEPVIIAAGIEQAFKISPAQLEAAISPRTRLVVINSPSNPSGKSYSRAEMTALAEVLLRYPEIVVVTDDIYEHIVWSEGGFFNILNVCPELTPRTLVLNGVSKAYAMTGWRIGYGGGPAELIKGMKKVQSQSTSNPCSIAQYAAQAALEGNQDFLVEMCAVFKQRHDYVCERLNAMPGVECLASDGTFYSFPSFQGVIARMAGINNDIELAQLLLESAEVALVPGSAFGGADHLRLSYATSMDNLEKALDRIATTISQG